MPDVETELAPLFSKDLPQPSDSLWLSWMRRFRIVGEDTVTTLSLDLDLLKRFGGNVKRDIIPETLASIIPLTEVDLGETTSSGQRHFHTEYIVFHNRGLSRDEVDEYATILTRNKPRQARVPKEKPVKTTPTKPKKKKKAKKAPAEVPT